MHLTANNAASATTNGGNSTTNNSSSSNNNTANGSTNNNNNNSSSNNNNTSGGNSSSNNNNSSSSTTNNQPLTPEQILQETYTKMTSDILAERTLGDFLSEHPGELIRTGSPLFVCTVLPSHWRSVRDKFSNFKISQISYHLFMYFRRTKLCQWLLKLWLWVI
jgi:runt-related transcription factor